jgi:hypothetical protein
MDFSWLLDRNVFSARSVDIIIIIIENGSFRPRNGHSPSIVRRLQRANCSPAIFGSDRPFADGQLLKFAIWKADVQRGD